MKSLAKNANLEDFDKACKALFPNYIEYKKICYELATTLSKDKYTIEYINGYLMRSILMESRVTDNNAIDCIKFFDKKFETLHSSHFYKEISELEYNNFKNSLFGKTMVHGHYVEKYKP